ncbi:MAG: TSUP family transporter [Sphingobacteriaceae bacterium]|nr:TSUP family transporter [Sphingobacteriaceae bacterium]
MNQIIILLIVGVVAGYLSGLIGIGGGIVIVPVLVYFLAMDQKAAQGTTPSCSCFHRFFGRLQLL